MRKERAVRVRVKRKERQGRVSGKEEVGKGSQ
jgi:hypothetical protein